MIHDSFDHSFNDDDVDDGVLELVSEAELSSSGVPETLFKQRGKRIIPTGLNEELNEIRHTACMQSAGGKEFLEKIDALMAEMIPFIEKPEDVSRQLRILHCIRHELQRFLNIHMHSSRTIAFKRGNLRERLERELFGRMKFDELPKPYLGGDTKNPEVVASRAGMTIEPGTQQWRSLYGSTIDAQDSKRLTEKINQAIGYLEAEITSMEHYATQVLPSEKSEEIPEEEFLAEPMTDRSWDDDSYMR